MATICGGPPAQPATFKIWAAEAGQRVVHASVHLHGGVGVDRDYPLGRLFLAAKQLELQLGGTTAQLRQLGRLIAANAFRPPPGGSGPGVFVASLNEAPRARFGIVTDVSTGATGRDGV